MTLEQAQDALSKHKRVYRSVYDKNNELYIDYITSTIDANNISVFANISDGTQIPIYRLYDVCPRMLNYDVSFGKDMNLYQSIQNSLNCAEMLVSTTSRNRISEALKRMQTRASKTLNDIPHEPDYKLWHQQEVYKRKRLQKKVKQQSKRIEELLSILCRKFKL